jgi:O-phosphoseryl-tRNA(Cys) synthetase
MNKKTTTIDDLAVMIEKESRANERRFDVLEEKISGLTDRVGSLEETVATKQDLFRVETRIMSAIGDINIELKSHDKRILALEKIVKP